METGAELKIASPRADGSVGGRLAAIAYILVAVVTGLLWVVAASVPRVVGIPGPGIVTGVAATMATLAGAAFHLRHGDAWSAHRKIVWALALSATSGLLLPLATILVAGAWLSFDGDRAGGLVAWSRSLLAVAQLANLASTLLILFGVRAARRLADRPGGRPLVVAIWVITLLMLTGPVGSLVATSGMIGLADRILTTGITAVQLLVGAALTVALLKGVGAGEQPVHAWRFFGGSRLVVLLAGLATPFVSLFVVFAGVGISWLVVYGELISLVAAVGLTSTFVLGFPGDGREGSPATA